MFRVAPLVAALLLASTLSAAPLAEQPDVASRLALYSLWVEDQRAWLHQPGVAIGIVWGEELVWARGFGVADLESGRPVTPETVFRLGSVSKTFTATALMQLIEAGRARLDDPLTRHLPGLTWGSRFEGANLTLWHLLTHTSGLPREAAFPYWTDRHFPTTEELHRGLAEQALLFEPGVDYQYSNLGLALLGEVVAALSGQSYEEAVRSRILAPLGMSSTWVELPPQGTLLATGYLIRRPDGTQPVAPETDARGLTPAANLSSNVMDLARYLGAHLGAGPAERQILKPATRREMQRVQWLSPNWTSGRGLGFSVWRQGERTLVGHGGWVAGHRSQIAFDPKTRVGVIVLTNSDQGGPGDYVRRAFEVVAPAIEKATAPPTPPAPAFDAALYAGSYHNPWGEVTEVLVLDGRLVLFDRSQPPADDPLASLIRLVPEGGHVFRLEGTERRLSFELRQDGRVGRLKMDENYLFPADCGEIGEDLRCTGR
ncbi:MAG TPA: serine hydrolase domain-containing protein [Thermoanaerobaculia bacterium]|nr:serine hydrolase domain-containing protein [Thermoanaerobaculia bacterium]